MEGWFDFLVYLLLDIDGHLLVVLELAIMLLLIRLLACLNHYLLVVFAHVNEAFPWHDLIEILLLSLLKFVLCCTHLSCFSLVYLS